MNSKRHAAEREPKRDATASPPWTRNVLRLRAGRAAGRCGPGPRALLRAGRAAAADQAHAWELSCAICGHAGGRCGPGILQPPGHATRLAPAPDHASRVGRLALARFGHAAGRCGPDHASSRRARFGHAAGRCGPNLLQPPGPRGPLAAKLAPASPASGHASGRRARLGHAAGRCGPGRCGLHQRLPRRRPWARKRRPPDAPRGERAVDGGRHHPGDRWRPPLGLAAGDGPQACSACVAPRPRERPQPEQSVAPPRWPLRPARRAGLSAAPRWPLRPLRRQSLAAPRWRWPLRPRRRWPLRPRRPLREQGGRL